MKNSINEILKKIEDAEFERLFVKFFRNWKEMYF